jgi:hypothetical protein
MWLKIDAQIRERFSLLADYGSRRSGALMSVQNGRRYRNWLKPGAAFSGSGCGAMCLMVVKLAGA